MTTDRAIDIIRRRVLNVTHTQRTTLSNVLTETRDLLDEERLKIGHASKLLDDVWKTLAWLCEEYDERNKRQTNGKL